MPDATITPPAAPFDGAVTPPGSKSLTNRALVIAALAGGTSTLANVLAADDTRVMIEGLRAMGFALDEGGDGTVTVHGLGGRVPAASADLHCGNSGTTIRFLTAVAALGRGSFTFDGVPRMRERPVGPLLDLLRNLGARVTPLGRPGFPPYRVDGSGLAGGLGRYPATTSSQFLSAVLMVAPYARHEVRIDLDRPQTSWPYVEMTTRLMDYFSVTPELVRDPLTREPLKVIVPQEAYRPTDYAVEPDASAASYFLAAAAVRPGARVTVRGLGSDSLQGDVRFAGVLKRMGAAVEVRRDAMTVGGPDALEGVDVDLADMPDVAQTLAVAALFAEGRTVIRGLHTLRVKETDRLAALRAELTKLGATATVDGDALSIDPPARVAPAGIDTYDDHRMAMSFAVAASVVPGVVVRDAGCVAKTYPRFFDDLGRLLRTERETAERSE